MQIRALFKKPTRPHLGPTPLAPLRSFASVYIDLHPFHATSVASIFHNLVASFGFTQAVGYLSSGSTLHHLKLSIFSFGILLLPTNDDGDIPFRVRQSYNSNPRALSLRSDVFVGYNNSVAWFLPLLFSTTIRSASISICDTPQLWLSHRPSVQWQFASFSGYTHILLCPHTLGFSQAIVIQMTPAVSTIHRLNTVSGAGLKDPSDEIPGGSNRSNYSSKWKGEIINPISFIKSLVHLLKNIWIYIYISFYMMYI